MNSDKANPIHPGGDRLPGTRAHRPEWADGLRQFYDSVVDEPLPDAFKDLLAKLDAKD